MWIRRSNWFSYGDVPSFIVQLYTLLNCVSLTHYARFYNLRVDTTQFKGLADIRIYEFNGVQTEPRHEFFAARVRYTGHLDDRCAECQLSTGR